MPGVNSTYRQIPDVAPVCSSDSWKRQDQLRGPQGQVPLLKLGSQDSGVEMAVGDSSLATSPSFSQDSLNFEPLESAESLALGALEPPAHLSRLLASRKLEQVLKRSHQLSVPPTSLSQHCHSPKLSPKCEMPHSEARGPEATEAESDLEDGLEQAEVRQKQKGGNLEKKSQYRATRKQNIEDKNKSSFINNHPKCKWIECTSQKTDR